VQPIVNESLVEGEAIGALPDPQKNGTKNASGRPDEAIVATAASFASTETIQLGTFSWTHEAANRLNRVPEGFMRDMTREKIQDYARQHDISLVTLEVAEKGIEVGRQLMAEMIAGYSQAKKETEGGNGHTAEVPGAPAGSATILNEVPGVQGTHA
jgi:hypothetical protein